MSLGHCRGGKEGEFVPETLHTGALGHLTGESQPIWGDVEAAGKYKVLKFIM